MVEVATLDDVPRLVALGGLLHDTSTYKAVPYRPEKVEALLGALIQGAGVVFVGRIDGVVVGGLAGAVTEHWFSDEKVGFEYSFFLDPAARHGITAWKIVDAFKRWCISRGAKTLKLGITTGLNVEGTAAFYRHIGFKDAGVLFEMEI